MSDDLISRKAVLDILTEERIRNSILASPAFGEMLAQRKINCENEKKLRAIVKKVFEERDKAIAENGLDEDDGIRHSGGILI